MLAAGLAWTRRNHPSDNIARPTHVGSAFLTAALLLQQLGIAWAYDSICGLAIIPLAAGFCLVIDGWPLLRRMLPAVLFLGFLVPLPDFVVASASQELQRWAAHGAALSLQCIGIPAVADGALLTLPAATLGVSEACSGLRMAMVLSALITAIALASPRDWPTRLLLIASAIPIAVATNIARITATACFVHLANSTARIDAIHDVAGWLMIPFAALLVVLEMRLLDRLTSAPSDKTAVSYPRVHPALRC